MKTLVYTFVLSLLCVSLVAQKVQIKDASSNVLMEVNDEGKSGSITLLPDLAPVSTTNKLYNISNELYWHGTKLGTSLEAAGWKLTGSNIYPVNLAYEVGIGTNSPSRPLEVVFTSASNNINPVAFFRTSGTGNSAGALKVQNSSTNYFTFGITQDPANAFALNYNRNISLGSDLLRILPTGELGLGTISPSAGLHVVRDDMEKSGYFQNNGSSGSAYGIYAEATNAGGIGHWGVYGVAEGGTYNTGISGSASNGSSNYGGDFATVGTGSNYAIFANASGGSLNYAGYFKNGDVVLENGKFGVRNTSPSAVMHITQPGTGDIFRVDDISPADASPFVIQDDGDVGIGITGPLAKQHIRQEGTDDAFRVDDQANDTSPFIIKSNGRTGIGLTEPAAQAHIVQTTTSDAFRVDDESGDTSPFLIDDVGNVGVGTSAPTAKQHIVQTGTDDAFRVDDGTGDTSPFVIKNNGNVGIGTVTANTKLQVAGYITLDEKIVAADNSGLKLCTDEQATRLAITDGGNVGIGTLAPSAKLEVNGSAKVNDDLSVDGEINRTLTGASNMVPIAFGLISVSGDVATVSSSTGNVSVARVEEGQYGILVTNFTVTSTNAIIIATPHNRRTMYGVAATGGYDFYVFSWSPNTNDFLDSSFQFVIYAY